MAPQDGEEHKGDEDRERKQEECDEEQRPRGNDGQGERGDEWDPRAERDSREEEIEFPEGLGQEAAVENEEEEEEVRPRAIRQPIKVSQQIKNEHELTHLPFRDWCQHCVRGKSNKTPHFKNKDTVLSNVPEISFDYGFLSAKDEEDGKVHLSS